MDKLSKWWEEENKKCLNEYFDLVRGSSDEW